VGDSAPKAVAVGFNPDAIVHCILQPLFAAEVVFPRLYAHVTQQKLDLLDLPTGNVTDRRPRVESTHEVEAAFIIGFPYRAR
jgi:hypothetical protein